MTRRQVLYLLQVSCVHLWSRNNFLVYSDVVNVYELGFIYRSQGKEVVVRMLLLQLLCASIRSHGLMDREYKLHLCDHFDAQDNLFSSTLFANATSCCFLGFKVCGEFFNFQLSSLWHCVGCNLPTLQGSCKVRLGCALCQVHDIDLMLIVGVMLVQSGDLQ